MVFASQAAGLVAGQVDTPYATDPYGDPQGTWDVFLRDRVAGKTTLLSRSKASPPTSAGGFFPALSADGNFAAFSVPAHDANGQSQSRFTVYDRAADALILGNHLPGSAQPDGVVYGRPALSADGRWIAYVCSECHLVPGEQSGRQFGGQALDVYLYDRVTNTNTLVSHASGLPATTGDRDSQEPRISADGRFVVFNSYAGDLAAGQTGPQSTANVFVFDRTTGAVTLVNHTAGSPAAASGPAYNAVISADGRWIAYQSAAADLVPGQVDIDGTLDVFLYDQVAGNTVLVSHASSSPVAAGTTSQTYFYGGDTPLSLSADGRWIAFASPATDLVPGEVNPNQYSAIYLYDRTTGAVSLVSSAAGSSTVTSYAIEPGISADGSRLTFLSPETNLIPGQGASRFVTLYLQERATGARTQIGRVEEKAVVSGRDHHQRLLRHPVFRERRGDRLHQRLASGRRRLQSELGRLRLRRHRAERPGDGAPLHAVQRRAALERPQAVDCRRRLRRAGGREAGAAQAHRLPGDRQGERAALRGHRHDARRRHPPLHPRRHPKRHLQRNAGERRPSPSSPSWPATARSVVGVEIDGYTP